MRGAGGPPARPRRAPDRGRGGAEPRVAILVPARDEEEALPALFEALAGVERETWARRLEVVVVDNGSRDGTAAAARRAGARVVEEPRAGYGRACRAGIRALASRPPDVLVFLDADDLEAPGQIGRLLRPIREGRAELVIGERVAGAPGAGVRFHAAVGNRLISAVLRLLYGARTRDMGPFRALTWECLRSLRLDDPDYGWYVQMQVRALRAGYRVRGVPVRHRRRTLGRSKVSGSLRGSLAAAVVMLRTLLVEALRPRVAEGPGSSRSGRGAEDR